ncbi:glyoxalase superfamily protein [Nocardiopsis trehalosi]|jgi:ribosomal-protein-alanine N-acetyltransferase|uniref:glyoxalase superfamily protein n=1 Tax=Nocardiopsis trehalosi TaxID=109329 RepID=UPI00082C7592|nr:glyoxalase superfamily protein [Nocardiopsis trehalosi]
MTVTFAPAVPVLRIFDVPRARAFYLGYLGFRLDGEHLTGGGPPVYLRISRGPLVLHLSEHHGDGCPGTVVVAGVRGVRAFHAELRARDYPYLAPAVEPGPLGEVLEVLDPFGTTLRFIEYADAG